MFRKHVERLLGEHRLKLGKPGRDSIRYGCSGSIRSLFSSLSKLLRCGGASTNLSMGEGGVEDSGEDAITFQKLRMTFRNLRGVFQRFRFIDKIREGASATRINYPGA